MKALSVKNLHYSYQDRKVLEDVSFDIEEGDMVGLMGPNGSGKTTLLRCINGFLRPKAGLIEIEGVDIRKIVRTEMAKRVSIVPQITSINFDFDAWDIVMMGRHPHLGRFKFEVEKDIEIVRWAMELTGTGHLADRSIKTLSGGELQRVIIARALAQQPKLMLLDEPTVHLDINHQIEIMDLVRKLNLERGITFLIVLHDLNLAAQYCRRLMLLAEGSIIADGTPREVLRRENIRRAYQIDALVKEHPYTSSVYVIPRRRQPRKVWEGGKKIHVICGGGSGSRILKMLNERRYYVTAGVLNVLDSDHEVASFLGIRIVDEAPFCEITYEAFKRNMEEIRKSDLVLVSSLWVGRGNMKNLEAAIEAQKSGKPIIILESEPFDGRNFAGEEARRLYEEIGKGAVVVNSEAAALKAIEESGYR